MAGRPHERGGRFFLCLGVRCRPALLVCCVAALGGGATTVLAQTCGTSADAEVLLADLPHIDTDGARALLSLVFREPERVAAAGRDVDVVRSTLLERADVWTAPPSLLDRAEQAVRRGDLAAADSLVSEALSRACTDAERADLVYRYGTARDSADTAYVARALSYDPAHGPSLYRQATLLADRVGRRETAEGRAAYWCVADAFRQAAGYGHVRQAALRAAAQYDHAAPTPPEAEGAGWRPGDRIMIALGDAETCTTTVR